MKAPPKEAVEAATTEMGEITARGRERALSTAKGEDRNKSQRSQRLCGGTLAGGSTL
jgi:hypothetical protein